MNLIALDKEESLKINGGGPTWNWSGKVLGAIIDLIEDICESYTDTPEGQAVQQALLDFQ